MRLFKAAVGAGCLGWGGDFIYIDEAGRARGEARQIDKNFVCACSVAFWCGFGGLGKGLGSDAVDCVRDA